MSICEGCIKQDVCKFKKEVEKYEKDKLKLPEPLSPNVDCKYKQAGPCPDYYIYPCDSTTISTGTVTLTDCYTTGTLSGFN